MNKEQKTKQQIEDLYRRNLKNLGFNEMQKSEVRRQNLKVYDCLLADCPNTFSTKQNLICHLRFHQKNGEYDFGIPRLICSIGSCGQEFASKQNLDKHKSEHAEPGGGYKCRFCGASFKTLNYLNRFHYRFHKEALTNSFKNKNEEPFPEFKPNKFSITSIMMDPETYAEINAYMTKKKCYPPVILRKFSFK